MWRNSFLLLIASVYHFYQCHCNNSLLDPRGITFSGNYMITDCEIAGRSTEVLELLPQVWQGLQLVLSDLEHGTASRYGVRTFLKTNTNAKMARGIFQAIADGRDLEFGQPVIGCLSPHNLTPSQEAIYNMSCVDHPNLVVAAAAFPRHGLVALCPEFWTLETFPEHDDCPAIGGRRGRRHFEDLGMGLTRTKFAALLHELIHLYNPLEDYEDPEEYSAEGCMELDAHKSIRNAGNLAFYASSKTAFHGPLIIPFSRFCRLDCIHWLTGF